MPELRFDGRVAVITGAGRGLGRAYALLAASRGAKVVVNDTGTSRTGDGSDAGPARDVVDEIRAAGGEAVACTNSVATPQGGARIIETALEHFGGVDILIHNAGIGRGNSFAEMTWDDFSATLDVHLHGAFHVAQPAYRVMRDAGHGRIVLTSSVAGLYGQPGVAGYSAGKTGVIGLSNAIALEGAAHDVTCNVIVPAAVTRISRETTSYPYMEAELVAPAVCWLAHETCKASGEMLLVLSGRIAKAVIAETRGVFQPTWTIEQVASQMPAIADTSDLLVFPPVPAGVSEHLAYSYAMAGQKYPPAA